MLFRSSRSSAPTVLTTVEDTRETNERAETIRHWGGDRAGALVASHAETPESRSTRVRPAVARSAMIGCRVGVGEGTRGGQRTGVTLSKALCWTGESSQT